MNDIMGRFYQEMHNIIYNVDSNFQDDIVDNLKKDRFNIITLDGREIMRDFINVTPHLVLFDKSRNNIYDHAEEEYREIQSYILNNTFSLDNYSYALKHLESKRNNKRSRNLFILMINDYLFSTIYLRALENNIEMSKQLSSEEVKSLKQGLFYIKTGDIESWLKESQNAYDIFDFFNTNSKADIVIKNEQYILDYDLQESINGYMSNTRIFGFRVSVMTSEVSMYHERYQDRMLQNNHDVSRYTKEDKKKKLEV